MENQAKAAPDTPQTDTDPVPQDPPSHAPRRRWLFPLLLTAQTLVLLLLLAEVVARLVLPSRDPFMHPWPKGYYVPDPECVYHASANFPPTWMRHVGSTTRNLCYSNSLGMRDIEPPPPDGHSRRILVIGSSMTEGMGVQEKMDPWPRRFEPALERLTSRPFTIMNGAVCGYNCFQMIARGRQLNQALQPDTWVMAYHTSMWGRNAYGPAGQYELHWSNIYNRELWAQIYGNRSAFSHKLMDGSALWRWLIHVTAEPDLGRNVIERPYGEDYERATREALQAFVQTAHELGIQRTAVVLIPMIAEIDWRHHQVRNERSPQVEAICRELNIPFFDPTPLMCERAAREHPGQSPASLWLPSIHDPHFLPEGNRIYAESLAQLMASEIDKIWP